MIRHVAYGTLDGMEVWADVLDLNTFLTASPDEDVHVYSEETQYTVAKDGVTWTRIQPVDRVLGCDETAHYRGY